MGAKEGSGPQGHKIMSRPQDALKEGVGTLRPRKHPTRAKYTYEIGDFKVMGTLEEGIGSLKGRASRGENQDLTGRWAS